MPDKTATYTFVLEVNGASAIKNLRLFDTTLTKVLTREDSSAIAASTEQRVVGLTAIATAMEAAASAGLHAASGWERVDSALQRISEGGTKATQILHTLADESIRYMQSV